MLRLALAEKIAAGYSIHDAALACNVSHSVAIRELEGFYGGRYRQSKRPEFAAGLAMHLLQRGHLATQPSSGSDWDDLLVSIRRYLQRHRLIPPGQSHNYPGSSRFSTVEQAAMVNKYLRAREENRGTIHMGNLFMKWGITSAMMDKWRIKFLKGNNPHYRDNRASKQREKILKILSRGKGTTIAKSNIMKMCPELPNTQLTNRLRELCRDRKIVSVYTERGGHLGYRLAGASVHHSKEQRPSPKPALSGRST